jgi:hypothetical protein
VPEQSIWWLASELEKLAIEVDPNSPKSVEFHAAEIFRGKIKHWEQMVDKRQRVELIKTVLKVLDRAYEDIVLFACAIHKGSFPTEDIVSKAYEDLSGRFNRHLERLGDGERGLIILDKSSYETGLQNLSTTIRLTGNRWGFQLRRIVEVPMFVDSRASRIIQLADHVAYAVFRRYNSTDLTYFDAIASRFYKNDGIIHGLAHLQIVNRNCTCPACLTRRDR